MPELVRGTVRDRHGPVASARVALLGGPVPLPDVAALTAADGTFLTGVPAPGRYTLRCTLPDGRSRDVDVDVRAGQGAQVEVEVG